MTLRNVYGPACRSPPEGSGYLIGREGARYGCGKTVQIAQVRIRNSVIHPAWWRDQTTTLSELCRPRVKDQYSFFSAREGGWVLPVSDVFTAFEA